MGQKVNPKSLRIGIINSWDSNWFAGKHKYKKLLHEDIAVRKFIKTYFKEGHISKIEILRDANMTSLILHTSRPGAIIGRQGEGIEKFQEIGLKYDDFTNYKYYRLKTMDYLYKNGKITEDLTWIS